MANTGFTRKKVATLTLGERLREIRSNFRISLAEVSKATKIQAKYLEYLENGDYHKLPADVYVRGFVRSYARFLNLDEETFLKLYDRERNIQANLRPEKKETRWKQPLSGFSLVITPRSIIFFCIILVLSGAFFYLYREFRTFAAVPRLVIYEPAPNTVVERSEVTVKGQTEKDARLSINNQPVFVGSEGEFTENLVLQPGINTITLVAVSRLEKERVETFSLEARYTPAEPAAPQATFFLTLEAPEGDVNLLVLADEEKVFEGILKKGETKRVEGRQRIRITTDQPAQTFVRFNEGSAEPLGAGPGAPREASFTQTGRETSEAQKEEL